MERMISIDKLLADLSYCAPELFTDKEYIMARIDKLHYEDVAPVIHAEWIWNKDAYDWGLGAWVCSNCRCRNDNISADQKTNPYRWAGSKYCPNCGARMGV